MLSLHREMAALHSELQMPQKTQKSSTNEEISTAWATTCSCLKEKAVVQEKKASWQAELAHRWNLMSCTIINNILLQLRGFQTHHKDGCTGMSLLWLITDSLYDQRFYTRSCWIKTFCIFKNSISYKCLWQINQAGHQLQPAASPSYLVVISYWPLFLQKA